VMSEFVVSWPRVCIVCGTDIQPQLEAGQTFYHVLKTSERYSIHPILFRTIKQTIPSKTKAEIHVRDNCLQSYKEEEEQYISHRSTDRKFHWFTIGLFTIPLLTLPIASFLGDWVFPVPSIVTLIVFLPAVLAGWISYYLVSIPRIRAGPRIKPPKTPFHNYIRLSIDGILLLGSAKFRTAFVRENSRITAHNVSFRQKVENKRSHGSDCVWGCFFSLMLAVLSLILSSFVIFFS